MTCRDLDELIEPLATGELAPSGEVRAHLDECAACREALALATSIERALAAQPAPAVPDRFVANVLARVRRHRWRAEQYVDLAFNAVVAITLLVAVGGLYAILTVSGVSAVAADVGRVFVTGAAEAARAALPQVRVYTLAALLAASCFALWWWAERGFDL